MKLSADRQSYLSHKLSSRLLEKNMVQAPSPEILFEQVKSAVHFFVQEWEEMEQEVLKKLNPLKGESGPDLLNGMSCTAVF